MSHSSKIWRLLESDFAAAEQPQKLQNRRIYPRFDLPQGHDFVLQCGEARGRITDISYGGISVEFEDTSFLNELGLRMSQRKFTPAKLEAIGKSVRCSLLPVFRENNSIGFCFRHDSSDELIFLKNLVECISLGYEIGLMPEIHASRNDQLALVGEEIDESIVGEISVQLSDASDILECSIVFKEGNIHYCARNLHGAWSTSQTIGMGGIIAPLSPTSRLDRRIMRSSALVISGLYQQCQVPEIQALYHLLVNSGITASGRSKVSA
jgi:hypothetical protein